MSVLLTCSLFGEEFAIGCGVTAKKEGMVAGEEIEIQIDHKVASSSNVGEGNAMQRSQCLRQDSVWYSFEDEADFENKLRPIPSVQQCQHASEVENSEDSTTLADENDTAECSEREDEISQELTISTVSYCISTASSGEQQRVDELLARLSDVLGPNGNAYDKESVQKLGGNPSCLWRFLVSVNNNIDAAEAKLRETMQFRREKHANALLENYAKVFESMEHVWPEVHIGTTSDGSPVSYFDVQKAVRFLKLGYTEDSIRSAWLYWMERSNAFQRQGRPCASSSISSWDMPGTVVIYNLEGLRLSQLTSCLGGLQQFCRVLGLAEQHYPTNLRKAIVLNSPSMFSRMAWPLVHKVLDAQTQSNVMVCDGANYSVLTWDQLGFDAQELDALLQDRL